jgi:ribonucleoside-diphosphate reductase alpha chain
MSTTTTSDSTGTGLRFERVFSTEGTSPYDQITWERRTAEILGKDGQPVFRQEDVEVPDFWSHLATAIVFDKYAYGRLGTVERESSVRQIVGRVVGAIVVFGWDHGYFATADDARAFDDELSWLLLNQYAAFNSPVWFNVGCRPGTGWSWDMEANDGTVSKKGDKPRYQTSACFILGMKDTIESIAMTGVAEMLIFKDGSGAGGDRSPLRSSREPITGGGKASGPVSFMVVYDSIGSVTKSGGRTRRAARMDTLKCWHPDILEFIQCKRLEEDKARVLIAAGYEADFNGAAYQSVKFQNCNMSVRATDSFLRTVEAGEGWMWQTLSVVTRGPAAVDGTEMPCYPAGFLMDEIALGTWTCGDPGLQFEDTIQRWHTTPNAGPIDSSNPCAEYMSLNDSACNLASLNLMKFRRDDGTFDVERFRAACRIFTVAQDILVDLGSYPTSEIACTAHRFRQLGLGYSNLGSLIMAAGLPYDSDEGRSLAGAITAIMTGQAYLTSAEMAERLGPFDGFAADRENMLRVMEMHHEAAQMDYAKEYGPSPRYRLWWQASDIWKDVCFSGQQHGYRNSQVTCLAPCGTIAFMMDCSTTGIEPAIALVSYKTLWGRGKLKLVNETVPETLRTLGYYDGSDRMQPNQIKTIIDFIDQHDTIEGAPYFNHEHLPVCDCAFPPANGSRSIHWRGHLKMVAAVQPFLSMGISKTINMPRDSTVADIRNAYMEGWKLGLKAVAIYRDGSKESQPVSTSKGEKPSQADELGIDKEIARDVIRRALELDMPQDVSTLAHFAGFDESIKPAVAKYIQALMDDERRIREVREDEVALIALGSGQPKVSTSKGDTSSTNSVVFTGTVSGEPVSMKVDVTTSGIGALKPIKPPPPRRERLPDTRRSLTHKFSILQHEGYVTVGFFPDGRPGELFIKMAKEGSTIGGLVDTIGTVVSMGLQYGVPLEVFVNKFAHQRFEPSGFTKNPDIPIAKSVTDYIFRWMGMEFVPGYRELHAPKRDAVTVRVTVPSNGDSKRDADMATPVPSGDPSSQQPPSSDGTTCRECGHLMVRWAGPCLVCDQCGSTSGGCS